MVFDLLSLGSKLRVWSSASPFHPPVVLRFQRVPMATKGGDDEEEPRAPSAGLKLFLQRLHQPDQQANGKRDGRPRPLMFSTATLEAWFLRQQEIPEELEVRNEVTGDQNRTKRPATSKIHSKRNPRRRARQFQKPNWRNQSLESKERVKYCEWCRSKPIQESASGAMSSMCEGCTLAALGFKLADMFQCCLPAWFDPLGAPPGLETPHFQFQWHWDWNNGWLSM